MPAFGSDDILLTLLGRPSVTVAGKTSKLASKRPEQLLVYLMLRGVAVPRDTLAAQFWPEIELEQQRRNLRKVLFRARRLPWGAALVITNEDVAVHARSDLSALYERIHQGDLPGALALAQGELLQAFAPEDIEGWAHALTFERRRMHNALRTLVLREAARHSIIVQIKAAETILAADPLDEDAVRLLMHALAADKRRAAALTLFNDFAERLSEELGLEVSAATRELCRTIGLDTADSPHTGHSPAPAPLARTSTAPGGESDPQPSPLLCVGRDADLQHVQELLRGHRFVVLFGPGGIGKSTLMRTLQNRIASDPDAACAYLDVAQVDSLAALESRVHQVLAELRGGGQALYLFLDNCEHVFTLEPGPGNEANAALRLERLLNEQPRLRVMCSSQARPQGAEAKAYPLSGLAVPQLSATEEQMRRSPAVDLFLRCVPSEVVTVSLPRELPLIVQICRAVAGFPLAIQLAASWTRVLNCSEILADLGHGAEVLGDTLDGGSYRQVVARSFQLLAPAEHEALLQLSVIPGDFDREIASAVCQAPLAVIASLLDKSLITRQQRHGLSVFSLHSLIHKVTRERLQGETSLFKEARRSLRVYVLEVCRRWAPSAAANVRKTVYDRIDAFPDLFRRSLEDVIAERDTRATALIVEVLYAHLVERESGVLDVAEHIVAAALLLKEDAQPHRPLVMRLLGIGSLELVRRFRGAEASQLDQLARALAEPGKSPHSVVGVEAQRLFWRDGKVEEAKRLILDRIEQGDLSPHEALELSILATDYEATRLDRVDDAIRQCQALFDEHVRRGTDRADAYHRLKLIELYCTRGQLDEAERLSEFNLRLAAQQPFPTNGLEWMAAAMVRAAKLDSAGMIACCDKAERILLGSERGRLIATRLAGILHIRAQAALLAGDIEQASTLLSEALRRLSPLPTEHINRTLSTFLPLLAELLLLTDRRTAAQQIVDVVRRDPRATAFARRNIEDLSARHALVGPVDTTPRVPSRDESTFIRQMYAQIDHGTVS
jgi:DNA-binding SARP family transcriptional activator